MPTLTSVQVTLHTLRLTAEELEALREAAVSALGSDEESPHREMWTVFARLGKPATRGRSDSLPRLPTAESADQPG